MGGLFCVSNVTKGHLNKKGNKQQHMNVGEGRGGYEATVVTQHLEHIWSILTHASDGNLMVWLTSLPICKRSRETMHSGPGAAFFYQILVHMAIVYADRQVSQDVSAMVAGNFIRFLLLILNWSRPTWTGTVGNL